jgi:pilus assembly protein CpaE
MQAHVLVVDDSTVTLFKLKAILSGLGHKVTTNADPASALEWLQDSGNAPDLVLTDVSMPGMDGYDFVRQLRAAPHTANVPIIMLTSHTELDHKVAGLEAGADDYVGKSVSPAELELRVEALLARTQSPIDERLEFKAKVLSVFSLRGGVGTTSIAVNLAAALAQLWGVQIPLLDLALTTGHCSVMLNLKPKETLAFLATCKDSPVEYEVLEPLLAEHDSGVKLLAAPLSPVEAELVTPTAVDKAWPTLQSRYPFLVVDAGSQLNDTCLTVLERSDQIVLVLSPELASIKSASDALEILDQLGIPSDRVLPVINSTFRDGKLRTMHIEPALGRAVAAMIPHEGTTFIQAINQGQPFVATNLKSKASLAIGSLAYQLSAEEMEDASVGHESPFLSRVRKTVKSNGHR